MAIFRYKEEEQMLEPIEDDALLEEVFEYYQKEYEDEEGDVGEGEEGEEE